MPHARSRLALFAPLSLVFLFSLQSLGAAIAQELGDQDFAAGPKVQVSEFTLNGGGDPAVAVGKDGDLVVVWNYANASIYGRRLDVDLKPVGSSFLASSTTAGAESPDVCADPAGDFVTVYRNTSADSIRARRNISGTAEGSQMVNTYTTGSRTSPAVDCTTADDFVVSWRGQTDGNFDTILARRFLSGAPADVSEFQVSSVPQNPATGPDIALNAAGDFVVVWGQSDFDSDVRAAAADRLTVAGVVYRPFASDGTPNNFQVPLDSAAHTSYRPRVDREAAGDFVVVWEGTGIVPTAETALLNNGGSLLASNSFVPTGSHTAGIRPAGVFAGPDSSFVVGIADDQYTFFEFQRYEDPLVTSGDSFDLGDPNISSSREPWDLAGRPDGSFVVVWRDGQHISAQQFVPALFADGFESGDATEWSNF